MSEQNWGCLDKMSEVNFSPAETLKVLENLMINFFWPNLINLQRWRNANHCQGLAQQKNEYGIEAGQILMQNIQERLTGLWPVTGTSSRRTARFAVSISASLTAGLTTSVDMGKAKSI